MFQKITDIWNKYGFTILIVSTLVFFLFYWFFFTRHNDDGTYNHTNKDALRFVNDPPPLKKSGIKGGGGGDQQQSFKSGKQITNFSKGERICKETLESIFQKPFLKVRPPFLYNSVTHENLELDLFNSDINLAVEYSGRQHYEYIPFFHGNTRDKFQNQKYRDEKKLELCKKNNVPLIIVPYTVPHDKIPSFLKDELRKLGKIQ